MDKLNIFIHAHRDFEPPVQDKCYKIITMTHLSDKELEIINETKGINLMNFDSCYSELTGFYWIWKNIKKEDLPEFIGFNHYRTYFSFLDKVPQKLHNDFIITLPPKYIGNLKAHYSSAHNVKDLDLCFKIVEELYPEYAEDIKKTESSQYLYIRNCFIMHKDVFYQYMEWLFSILFKFDEVMGFKCYDDVKKHVDSNIEEYKKLKQVIEYQYRIEGFLSERLFTLWLKHNYPNNMIYVDMYQTENINRYKEN